MINSLKDITPYNTIMGRYILTKKHLTTLYVFLDAYTSLLKDMEKDIKRFDNINHSKLLLFVKLLNTPNTKWVSRDEETLSNIISYMLWATLQRMDEFNECLYQLEKRAKKELATGEMSKSYYLEHRKTHFELKKLLEALMRVETATMTFDNWDDKNEDKVNIEA